MILNHFTDNMALFSILENRQLWATNYTYLNDMDEIIHLKDIFLEENMKFINSNNSNEKYIEFVNKIFRKYFTRIESNSYVLSFTTNKDKFNLWSYFSNDNGYSIGFSKEKLCKQFKIHNWGGCYQKENNSITDIDNVIIPKEKLENYNMNYCEIIHDHIVYSENKKRNYIKKMLDEFYSLTENQFDDDFTSFDYLERIIEDLMYRAYFFKKEGFEYENEYRFVFILKKGFPEIKKLVHYRANGTAIVPYIKVNIDLDDIIDNINIGPWIEKNKLKRNLEQYLEYNYKYKIDVIVSDMNIRL